MTTATAGIACAKCSGWENGRYVQVHHADINEVRLCSQGRLEKARDARAVAQSAATIARQQGNELRDRIRAAAAKLPDVQVMRYAIERDNTVEGTRFNFYQVDRPQEGKWKGYTFVKQFSSDDLIRLNMSQSAEILEAIAADVQTAAANYGLHKKRCGKCHRKLTRDDSRKRGYGPDCAAMLGIDF